MLIKLPEHKVFSEVFFRAILGEQKNYAESTEFPSKSRPDTCTAFPVINILHQNGTFETIDKHYYYSKSIVYIRDLSKCCTFYDFGKIYNDMYPPLE